MPVVIDEEWYGKIKNSLPELPEVKKERYISELELSQYDAEQITQSRAFCDVFEEAYDVCKSAKEVANWLITDCMTILNKKQQTADSLSISGKSLGELIKLVADDKVTRGNAKRILSAMFEGDVNPLEYAEKNGLIVSNDTGNIEAIAKAVVDADPKSVADYKSGKEKALMALFGKCMKELKGNCNPQVLREILIKVIDNA